MTFSVVFKPEGRSVAFDAPVGLSDAAAQADVLIDHPCGANATCGKCRVRFVAGAVAPTAAEQRLISAEDLAAGWRLSCQSVVSADAKVEVPPVSRSAAAKGFGDDSLFPGGFTPLIRRRKIVLREPDLDNQVALEDALGHEWGEGFQPCLRIDRLTELQQVVGQFAGEPLLALFDDHELLDISSVPARNKPRLLGIACDVGSTSVAAALIDLETGNVLAEAAGLNPQVRFGGDVISRIEYAQNSPDGNQELQREVVGAVNQLIADLTATACVEREEIWGACVAGNPAMLHTLLGVDVAPLGQAPYVGAWTQSRILFAEDIGIDLQPPSRVRIMPMIRSNVGADTVAAIIATGMDQSDKLSLLIDMGTNCEVVLGNRDRLLATSTAAGPAFEGANIRHGMRASPGAIDRVTLRPGGSLFIHIIGGVKARGICGSALIDTVAALLRAGVVDASGRMHGREALDQKRFPGLAPRIITGEHGHSAFILATREESERGVPVMLSALDIRQLQLIKGSILAGANLLMKTWGTSAEKLDRILIAGAFGSFLRKRSLLEIGLIPQIDPEQVLFTGNSAGVGARMALVDRGAWDRANKIRERAEYLELGGHPDYQDEFGNAMGFHHCLAIAKRNSG